MNKEYFPVQVGDQVMINPGYWAENQHHFMESYKSNGADHIYTVTRVSGDGNPGYIIDLDGHDGGWDNDLEYLIPVPLESELGALGDISVLFE